MNKNATSSVPTMIGNWIMRSIFIYIVLIGISACNQESLSPISSGPPLTVDFLIGNPNNPYSASDTIPVNIAVLFNGRSSLSGIIFWEWDFGDGTRDSGQVVTHKYTTPGTYNVCLRVWTSATQYQQYCRTIYVGTNTTSMKPIFKSLGAVNLGNGTWEVTYGLLRSTGINCNMTQPFIAIAQFGWDPPFYIPNPNDTTDGYWKYKQVVQNYARRSFSYGGHFPDCYAWIAPHGNYSSEYYVPDSGKIIVIWVDGQAVPVGGVNNSEPGLTGDTGPEAVTRVGISPYSADTIVFYFHKGRVIGSQTSPFWVNSITGMINAHPLTNAAGYSNWWRAAIHINSLPIDGRIAFKYGGNYSAGSWAIMSGSYFWNPGQGYMEAYVRNIGGQIYINDQLLM